MDSITSTSLVSLNSYIGEILKSTNMDKTNECMKNEWARYISFGSFPPSSPVHPTRLAQSGFYYSGTGDETICFSCGLKNRNWKEGDSPFDVHKKLSPSCDFVNGSGDGNMPIRCRGIDFVHSANSLTGLKDKEKVATHYQNSTQNVNSNNRNENEVQPKLLSAMDRTENKEQSRNDVNAVNTELGSKYSFTDTSCVQEKRKESENTRSSLSKTHKGQPGMFQNNIEVAESLEKPKHLHYSALTSRLESFRGWPSYIKQKPADLAAAGFYYVGVGDCVRCFFCGGGLRSWEEGDDPWEEHAHWYPDCAFLQQCRGDEFMFTGINLRSDESLEIKTHDNPISEEEKCEDIPCTMTLGSKARETDPEDPMDCPATQSILAMGYNIEMVRHAMQIFTTKNGHITFSATDLMEIIFELEENETKLHTAEDSDTSRFAATEATVQHTVVKPTEYFVDKNEKSGNDSFLNHNDHVEKETNDQSPRSSLSPEELEALLEQNQELKDQATCKICMDRDACIVFLPCCHMMSCPQCAPALRKCPVCRQLIKGTVRAYIP